VCFEISSNLDVNKSGIKPKGPFMIQKNAYFRKGIVGDWKNHLILEMEMRLNDIMGQKLSGSGLT